MARTLSPLELNLWSPSWLSWLQLQGQSAPPPEITSTDVTNETRNYDFQADYRPAIIFGIMIMTSTLWRSDGYKFGRRQVHFCYYCIENVERRRRRSALTLSSNNEDKAALKPNSACKVSLAICYSGNRAHLPAIRQRQPLLIAVTSYWVAPVVVTTKAP